MSKIWTPNFLQLYYTQRLLIFNMKSFFIILLSLISINLFAIDHKNIVSNDLKPGYFPLIENAIPGKILMDENDDSAVKIAI